jgi:glucuronokinase
MKRRDKPCGNTWRPGLLIIRKRAFARAALLGNPSDGYHGQTLSVIVRNFSAEVVLYEWDSLEILLSANDRANFRSIQDLVRDVELHGYYGGIRLIKATIKRFVEYAESQGLKLHERNFSIRYHTSIPQQVGLGGSSAIILATLRCLMEFYEISIPLEAQPSFVLSVERDKLGIMAGLQDRVIQVYEGLVHMDFALAQEHLVNGLKCYHYEPLSPSLLPPLYLAYHHSLSEPTEVFHNDIRGRFNRGEAMVVEAMRQLCQITQQGRAALLNRDYATLAVYIDKNFDVRHRIYQLPAWQTRMVEVARQCGASANFAGSGGAIIGSYQGPAMYEELCARMTAIGSRVIQPRLED